MAQFINFMPNRKKKIGADQLGIQLSRGSRQHTVSINYFIGLNLAKRMGLPSEADAFNPAKMPPEKRGLCRMVEDYYGIKRLNQTGLPGLVVKNRGPRHHQLNEYNFGYTKTHIRFTPQVQSEAIHNRVDFCQFLQIPGPGERTTGILLDKEDYDVTDITGVGGTLIIDFDKLVTAQSVYVNAITEARRIARIGL